MAHVTCQSDRDRIGRRYSSHSIYPLIIYYGKGRRRSLTILTGALSCLAMHQISIK